MKLKYAKIVNFRSIQEVRVDFKPSCRTLVGINESGKSNILRALSMISPEFKPSAEDVREPLPKEKPVTESYIWFVFSFDESETDIIYSESKKEVLAIRFDAPVLAIGSSGITLEKFCNGRNEGLYAVDLIDKNKSGSYWTINTGYTVKPNWKKPSAACPNEYTVQIGTDTLAVKKFSLINADDFPEIPEAYLAPSEAKDVNAIVGKKIKKFVEERLPKVIFWKYEEKNLLPPIIKMDEFVANPDKYTPLKNMFTLAGYTDIPAEIGAARKLGGNKLRNLLRRVATHTTKHFRDVWKEYKEISFALEPNADTIEANIVEKNYWKMEQRSDGVKRFITFLLHVSANIKANLLKDALLLIDEPDMSLHPSGCRYLRDELIDNAKNNYVVFSTHSIFMIDKENIGRHIIVKKEAEKTTAINATTSNFIDEEVLFNALNYTVFDILQRDNILFEGWRDKKLFQVAISRIAPGYASDLKPLRDKLKTLGLCHAEGVKDVRNITPLLELAGRNCLIISDADKAAKEKQKEFLEIHGYGTWKRYDEILAGTRAVTGEDFLTNEAFSAGVAELKKKYPSLTGDPSTTTTGRLDEVRKWLIAQGVTGDQHKEKLEYLKTSLFDALVPARIDSSYYDFLKALAPLTV